MQLRSNSPFRSSAVRALLCVALAAVDLSATAADAALPAASAATAKIIDVDEVVYDRSQVEWSEAYLQWIASFSHDNSPISDTSGALCAAKQEGDVWFLATTDGTGPVERNCSIPAGKTLFVPLATTLERSGNKEPICATMAPRSSTSTKRTTRPARSTRIRPVPCR